MEWFRSAWLDGTGVGWQDPRVSLLAAEAAEFGRRAQAAGNDVLMRAVQGGQHSFITAAGRVPEVDGAIAEIGAWLRTALGLAAREGRESA